MKRENRTSRILELRNKFESEKAISDPPPSPTSNDIKLKRSSFNQVTSNIINTESKLKRSSLNYDKLKKWGNRWEPGLKSKSRELNQVKEKKNDETNIQESNLIDNNVIKTDEPLELLKEKEEKVEVEGNIGISTNNSVDLIKQQFDNMNIGDLEPKNLIKEGIDDIVKEEEDVTIKNNEPIDLIEESFNNVNNLDNIQQGNKNENNLNSQNEESIDLTEEGFDTINNKEETQQVKDDSIKNPEPILSTKGEALALTINQGGDIQNLISNGAIDDLSIQLKDPVWSSEEEIVNHLATDNHKRGSFLTADNSIILSEYSMSESDPSGNLRLDENGNDVLSISRLLGDDALLNENSFLNDKSGVSSSFFDEKSKLEEGLVNGHSSSFIINQEEEEDNNKPVLEWEKKESDNIVSEDSNALDKGDTKEDNLINKNIILGDNNVDSILENDSSVKLVDNKENELSNDRVVFDNSITEPKDDKVKDNEVVSPNNNQSYKNSVVLDNDNTKLINNINNDTILNNNNPLEEISGDVYKYTNNTILENSNNRLEDSILSSENTVYRKVINDGIELDNNITVNENTSMNGDVINRDIMLDNSINNSVNNNNILDSTTSMKNSKDVNAISNNNMSKETQQHKKAQLSNVSEDQLHDITSLYYEDVTNSEEENEIIESNKEYLKYLQIEIPEECYIPLQCFIYQESIAYFSLLKEFEGAIFNANIKKNYFVAWEKWQENIINAAKQLFAKEGLSLEPEDLEFEIDFNLILILFKEDINLSKSILLQLLISLIKDGNYDNKTRHFLILMGNKLNVTIKDYLNELEIPLALDLFNQEINDFNKNSENQITHRENQSKTSRWAWTSLGAIGGGVALAVTGGLAAPLVLPYMGAVFGASSLLAGTSGIALVTSLFGATGAGLAGYRVSRRIGSIKEFTFLPLIKKNELKRRSLNVTIGISGWLKSEEDLISPWKKLKEGDMYCLKYETEILLSIGQALNSLLATSVIGIATNEVLKKTILNGLVASIAWPLTILQAGSILDNPWSLGLDRSKKAGLILADALINYAQGHRPVNLVGFSLGARVIFYCLEELLLRSENNFQLFDIIENVVLLGAPITCDKKRWKAVRTLISGRFINGYIEQDWILSFLHRGLNYGQSVAGNINLIKYWKEELSNKEDNEGEEDEVLDSDSSKSDIEYLDTTMTTYEATSLMKMKENSLNIKNNTIIESVDLSEIVEGHLDYINQVPTILNKLGFQINEFESDVVPETLFETTFTF